MPTHEFPKQTVAQLTAQCRQAIVTTLRQEGTEQYVLARCDAGHLESPWDDTLDHQGNHAAAALALLTKLGWHERNHLVMGSRGAGMYLFVQVPPRHWPKPGLEYCVDDASGEQHVFNNASEAAGFAVSVALTGREVNLDVLTWNRDAAVAYGGDDAGEVYDEDPEASVFDRIAIRAESQGRVA